MCWIVSKGPQDWAGIMKYTTFGVHQEQQYKHQDLENVPVWGPRSSVPWAGLCQGAAHPQTPIATGVAAPRDHLLQGHL